MCSKAQSNFSISTTGVSYGDYYEELLKISFNTVKYYVCLNDLTDYGAPYSRDLRLLSKHA